MSARGLCNRELAYARELLAAGDSPALRSAVRLQLMSALRYFWQEIASSHGVVQLASFDNLPQLRSVLQQKLGQEHPIAELNQMEESPLIAQLLRLCDPADVLSQTPDISHKISKSNIIKTSQDTESTAIMDVGFERNLLEFLQNVVIEWREYSQEY
ncbi:MAG: hypothetical protein AB8B48_00270 [Pseudomonadales bacterium]